MSYICFVTVSDEVAYHSLRHDYREGEAWCDGLMSSGLESEIFKSTSLPEQVSHDRAALQAVDLRIKL